MAREEGREAGKRKGSEHILRQLLVRRFGPEWVEERIAPANAATLEGWIYRVLDAQGFIEVFAD